MQRAIEPLLKYVESAGAVLGYEEFREKMETLYGSVGMVQKKAILNYYRRGQKAAPSSSLFPFKVLFYMSSSL